MAPPVKNAPAPAAKPITGEKPAKVKLTAEQKAARKAEIKTKREGKVGKQKKVLDAIREECKGVEATFLDRAAKHEMAFDRNTFANWREFALYRARGYELRAQEWAAKATEQGKTQVQKVKKLNKLKDQLAALEAELEAAGIKIDD